MEACGSGVGTLARGWRRAVPLGASAFTVRCESPERRSIAVNMEKVVFGFFVLLAATLNFGFFIGDLGDPEMHSIYELFAAVVVNLIATVLKFGDRTQLGAVHLATSLVASLQLIAAAVVWTYMVNVGSADVLTAEQTATVVSLSGGALFANVVSVILLVVETVSFQRR
jgi:hypothetical protein